MNGKRKIEIRYNFYDKQGNKGASEVKKEHKGLISKYLNGDNKN